MTRWTWIIACALAALGASPVARAQVGAKAEKELVGLLDKAPGRQAGQPGNDAIDKLIQKTFTDAVSSHNDHAQWAAAQETLEDSAKSDAAFTAARDAAQIAPEASAASQDGTSMGFLAGIVDLARWFVGLVLDSFVSVFWILIALAATALLAWWFQRRKSLLIVGVSLAVAAVLMLVVGAVAANAKEMGKSVTGGAAARTTAELNAQVQETAKAAWKAELAAAAALKGQWQCGRVTYPTAVFLPGEAKMSVAGGSSVRLYAMGPNLIEPTNLPAGGVSGPLVYAGRARADDLSGGNLRLQGAAVVVEFDCGNHWLDTVQLGAKVVIVLEPADAKVATSAEAAQKQTPTPLSVPRFYIKRRDMVAALGDDWEAGLASGGKTVKIEQSRPSTWQQREVAADWLFIPAAADADAKEQLHLVHFQAYKDCRSIVPELSPGASSAGNLVLMLRLLDQFEKQPPRRPVLLSVVNEHTNALLGEQEFDHAAFADAAAVLRELGGYEKKLATAKFYQALYSQDPSAGLVEKIRTEDRGVAGARIELKKPLVDKLSLTNNRALDERTHINARLEEDTNRVKKEQLPALIGEQERQGLVGRVEAISRDAGELIAVIKLFNKFGKRSKFEELKPAELGRLRGAFKEVADDNNRAIAALDQARQRLTANMALRRRLLHLQGELEKVEVADADAVMAQLYSPLPSVLAVGLDLSFGSPQMGFFYLGDMTTSAAGAINENNENSRATPLSRRTLKLAEQFARASQRPNPVADTILNAAGVPWRAYLGGRFAIASDVYCQYQIPALTLLSVRDMRPRAYTPFDTSDAIDPAGYSETLEFAAGYLPRLVDDPELMAAQWNPGVRRAISVELSARMHDEFAVMTPEAPLPDALVLVSNTGSSGFTLPNNSPMFADVQSWLVTTTDVRGTAIIRGSVWRDGSPLVATYDASYSRMTSCVDMGDWEVRIGGSAFNAGAGETYSLRPIVAIELNKVDLIGLTQPLTLTPLDKVSVLDARQDSVPRRVATMGVQLDKGGAPGKAVPVSLDGTGSVFLEPGASFKLRVGTGLVINATPAKPQGEGFSGSIGLLPNLAMTSSQDMWYLTQRRLEMLSSKGVRNETAETFNAQTQQEIKRAESAQKAGRNAEVVAAAEEARGLAYNAYQRGRGTIDDLTKAVVIFLALVIPFCIFVTKLTSPFNDVNRNVSMFIGIFLLMALVLRFVHPAFAVAETPEVVILAFVILGLAGFVGSVLIGRFNASMTQAIEEAQMSESTDAPQSRLAGVAFVVGVNNMKRRRIRTSLTTATIVLVTFTMLSVISVGQDVALATVRVAQTTPYNGLLFVRPGLAPINSVQLDRLRAHFQGGGTVTARAWAQRLSQYGGYLGYELIPQEPMPGARIAALKAKVLVGMEPAEDGLTGRMPLVAGRWLSSDVAAEVVLSVEAAKLLGITPENFTGKRFTINGRSVELVGLLDDDRLAEMRDLADLPLLPLLSQASQTAAAASAAAAADASGSSQLDAGAILAGANVDQARPTDVAFVSLGFARATGEADYRTLSVKYDKPGGTAPAAARTAWDAANQLIRFQYALVSVGMTDPVPMPESNRKVEAGQYTLASSSTTPVRGVLKIAIPIILAATIILNTMLGSVIERRREVSIYNAIGLNPGHVMVFFLAESLVFGLVGSVAGYLIGQTLSLAITHFHWVNLNLNYSSLSVVVVIFLSIATVLLSTVYPAVMAARAAVPSGQRRWSLPQPVGDEIFVQFPFSYDAARVLGVCAYLRDYMRQNTEASMGQFLARLGPVGMVAGSKKDAKPQAAAGDAGKTYVMVFDIAPAPFDLGVNQKMEVYAYYDPRVRAHMLSVHLTRTSGERGNWVAVNQPFLESLRKRLLGWRSQKPATQQSYFHEGDQLFAQAAELPAAGPGTPGMEPG